MIDSYLGLPETSQQRRLRSDLDFHVTVSYRGLQTTGQFRKRAGPSGVGWDGDGMGWGNPENGVSAGAKESGSR